MKRLIVFLVLLMPALSLAQNLNADGKDYYIGWLYPSYNSQKLSIPSVLNFLDVSVLISSYDDNTVTISYFDTTGKETVAQTLQVAKRRSIQVHIDTSIMHMTGDGEIAEWKSMHITAKKPIKVEFFSSGSNSGGSYLPIATNFLGKNYVVESYADNTGGAGGLLSNENSSGYFMVIAAFDGTTVQIIPNATTKAKQAAGVNCGNGATGTLKPFNVTLQRGQCYMVKSQGTQGCDISGSTVTSDKPVAVLGGHEDAWTSGSDVGTIHVEGRDFMVEQMLPVEYWDSVGYFSLPFVDSKNAQGGDGDNLAIYYGKPLNAPANYPGGTTVTLNAPGPLTYSIGPYPSSVAIKTGVTSATSAYSSNGAKIHVVQYDQRMQGAAPYPAPSQMSLIPMSRWKTSYMWYVPANTKPEELYQGYYITLICDKEDFNNGTLQWSQDGGPLVPVKTAGTVGGQKTFGVIAPSLIGMAIKQNAPRSYYITSTARKPFIVYNYSFRGLNPDRALGTFSGKDQFFSAATATGFGILPGGSTFNNIIDTGCGKWNVCSTTKGTNSPKIKSITLLNDPSEDQLDKPNSTKGYVSYNVRFDKTLDPSGKGEIEFAGTDSNICTTVTVQNPLDSAYGAVMVLDDNGSYSLIELKYKASALADTIKSTDFDVSNTSLDSTIGIGYHRDTIIYTASSLGTSECATVSYFITGDSAKVAPTVVITSMSLTGDNFYSMQSNLVLPATLRPASASHPADTLKLTICFNPQDANLHVGTVTLKTDCFDVPLTLIGRLGSGLITATDCDFGNTVIGQTDCSKKITIRNIGNLPFILTNKWVIDNLPDKEFSMDPQSNQRLPITLWPANDASHLHGDTVNLFFCYSPINIGPDSVLVTWLTDIKPPFTDQVKSWSFLKGNGVSSGVIWDRTKTTIVADSITKPTLVVQQVFLKCIGSRKIRVDKVFFSGPDAAEFRIVGNQLNMDPLEGFDMNPGDSMWIDIAFAPDYTHGKFQDRHGNLTVTSFSDATHTIRDTNIMDVTGTFKGVLGVDKDQSSISTLKAYYQNHRMVIEFPSDDIQKVTCSLYDILGRKVIDWLTAEANSVLALPMPKVSTGVYVLKIQSDGINTTCKVLVQ